MVPPAAETSEEALPASKRRRIALACTACRVRKTKCNGERPTCSTCLALGLPCNYDAPDSSANIIVRKEYISDLERRVLDLEGTVQRLNDTLKGHLATCIDLSAARPSAASQATGLCAQSPQVERSASRASDLEEPQDEDYATDGMAMIFVEERTSKFFGGSSNISFARLLLKAMAAVRQSALGMQVTLDTQYNIVESSMVSFSPARAGSSVPLDARGPSAMDLPPTVHMDAMLDTYFNTSAALFPFIHEGSFRQTYDQCRRNGFTKVRRTWLGVLNMIFAMASTYNTASTATAPERFEKSNVFYQRATILCGEISRRVVNLEIVHHLLLVVLYCQGTQRSVQAWNMHGFLVRSAIALGLHIDRPVTQPDSWQEESFRRTWMTIYCLDKVLSMTFGRPAAIPDEYVESRSTTPWQNILSPELQNGASDLSGEFLSLSFRLYQIMGRSLSKQYGANLGREDLELDGIASLQASGEFRKALHMWESDLPLHLGLCEPHSSVLAESSRLNRLRVILTLRYHNVSILVHRPLLATTLRHLFHGAASRGYESSYLVNLAMADAYECVSSAEITIDIVYSVLVADQTSSNNLGVWFFNLYYVFTASLVVSARLLWARYGQATEDDTAAKHAVGMLQKVEQIFEKLDSNNELVSSCAKYIHHLSDMQTIRATDKAKDSQLRAATVGSKTVHIDIPSTTESVPSEILETDEENADPFQLLASEIFDPSVFEGFETFEHIGNLYQ